MNHIMTVGANKKPYPTPAIDSPTLNFYKELDKLDKAGYVNSMMSSCKPGECYPAIIENPSGPFIKAVMQLNDQNYRQKIKNNITHLTGLMADGVFYGDSIVMLMFSKPDKNGNIHLLDGQHRGYAFERICEQSDDNPIKRILIMLNVDAAVANALDQQAKRRGKDLLNFLGCDSKSSVAITSLLTHFAYQPKKPKTLPFVYLEKLYNEYKDDIRHFKSMCKDMPSIAAACMRVADDCNCNQDDMSKLKNLCACMRDIMSNRDDEEYPICTEFQDTQGAQYFKEQITQLNPKKWGTYAQDAFTAAYKAATSVLMDVDPESVEIPAFTFEMQ